MFSIRDGNRVKWKRFAVSLFTHSRSDNNNQVFFTHLAVHDEFAAPAQIFGQQGALHVTAEGVLRSEQEGLKPGCHDIILFTRFI